MTQLIIDDVAVEVSMAKLQETPDLFPEPKPYLPVIAVAFGQQPQSAYAKDEVVPISRMRTYIRRADGTPIGTTKEVTYKDEYVDQNGAPVSEEQLLWLIFKDDKYQRVKQYSKTKIMQGIFPIPATSVSAWLPKTAYEIFVNQSHKVYNDSEYQRMKNRLFQKAEEWAKANKAMIGKYVFKEGAQPYVMVLFPYLKKLDNGTFQFVFVAFFSRTKNEYQNLMDVIPATAQQAIEILDEPSTDEILAAVAQ